MLYNQIKGVDHMANIPSDKQQVMITLPKVIIDKIDKLAVENFCKRAEQTSRIIIDYFKEDSK
jgi:metal-responsive CopG/Arc/MetJ family transcriptional regulator